MDRILYVNGRDYRWPEKPTVVICIDGNAPDYFARAMAAGLMPRLGAWVENGAYLLTSSVIPSYTNPNNISIITGVSPATHGISGNYFLDPETGEETMMDDPKFLRAPTIMANFSHYGARVAVVTAKDKLRRMLGSGLDTKNGSAVCFSAEKADQVTEGGHGIGRVVDRVGMPVPDVYSAELSEFVLAAGVMLLDSLKPDLMYLSTTDYIQHLYKPGSVPANRFYATLDRYLDQMERRGAAVVLTADHGMNDKTGPDRRPNVIYLQRLLDRQFPHLFCRVILPITDPYVVHHGALGSYAVIYLNDTRMVDPVMAFLQKQPGLERVHAAEEAVEAYELPRDRIGQIVVLAGRNAVLGQTPENHDLSLLKRPLRSHGGLSEQLVPMVMNFTLKGDPTAQVVRNFDAFSIALNQRLPKPIEAGSMSRLAV